MTCRSKNLSLLLYFACFLQDESLFASPKRVTRPGEEDGFAAALSERSRRRSGK